MKNLFTVLFAVAAMVCAPQVAKADFFDSSKWYMDADQWVEYTNTDNADPAEITITDQNDRLEFSSIRNSFDDNGVYRADVSLWSLDLNYDFDLTIDYHHNAVNPFVAEGGTAAGFSSLDLIFYDRNFDLTSTQDPDFMFLIGARSSLSGDQSLALQALSKTTDGFSVSYWDRALADGIFEAIYDTSLDRLTLTDLASGNSLSIDGLRETYNLDSLKVALNAGSDGYSYSGEDANFKNLVLNNAVITPEPVSSVLFLIGGGAMAFARRRMFVKA